METLSRSEFLRGAFRGGRPVVRPPWAVAAFVDLCDRCGDCLGACPEGILVTGDGGFPEVDFALGACTFCGDCAAVCPTGAVSRDAWRAGAAPWRIRAEVTDDCLTAAGIVCRLCEESCEPRAIRFANGEGTPPAPTVSAEACTGCGACVGACPADAFALREEVR